MRFNDVFQNALSVMTNDYNHLIQTDRKMSQLEFVLSNELAFVNDCNQIYHILEHNF